MVYICDRSCRIKATFYRSWPNVHLLYVKFHISTKHHHLKGIFWNLSNMFCCNIWCKIEHVGCKIHWHNFGKMWFRPLRASLWCSNAWTHATFSTGKCFYHVDKNSRDGINKKCFPIIIWLHTFNGRLKCQIFRKMQQLIVKLQRVNSLFSAKRLNRVLGTFSNYRPLFRILSINQFKITGLWFQLEDTQLPHAFRKFL